MAASFAGSFALFVMVVAAIMGIVALGIILLAQRVTNPFWRTVVDVALVIAVLLWAYAMFMPG